MPATLNAPSPLPARSQTSHTADAGLQPQASECHVPGCAVNSFDLLQGQKTVAITHNGLIYRLQATRLGKLILTK